MVVKRKGPNLIILFTYSYNFLNFSIPVYFCMKEIWLNNLLEILYSESIIIGNILKYYLMSLILATPSLT